MGQYKNPAELAAISVTLTAVRPRFLLVGVMVLYENFVGTGRGRAKILSHRDSQDYVDKLDRDGVSL